MSPAEVSRAKRVYEESLKQGDHERQAFIRSALAGDAELAAAALKLLAESAPSVAGADHDSLPRDQRPTALLPPQFGARPQYPATIPFQALPEVPAQTTGTMRHAIDQERFYPGQVVGERYRVVAMLGRGGMGEVYRADDLKLGITVALKFLPRATGQDDAWRARFLDEVRLARSVSHPNVVRVFDVGETNGDTYLSMEYVDGETLDSLLSRINRLPELKANQLAQELCAGLAAIHDAGILHRDLKPTNVMIDGRGRLRLTDFGLAARGELGRSDVAAGTPGYIAPESIAGRETTLRSDVYSLGLVLYELYTGSAAYPGTKNADLLTTQSRQDPVPPSVIAPDIDPGVERVIQNCLEREPRLRPGSARHVAAMLPGGSPLAATLAAGETPSPEMVAAGGRAGRVSSAKVAVLLSIAAVALVCGVIIKSHASLVGRVALPKSGEVLAERSREILQQLGYPAGGGDERFGFDVYEELLAEIIENDTTPGRWEQLNRSRPAAIDFWYRRLPGGIRTQGPGGRVTWDDPPLSSPGMVSIRLSPSGQLRELVVVDEDMLATKPTSGSPRAETADARGEPDWNAGLRAADLDPAQLTRVEPQRIPQVFADHRAAWAGAYPESPDTHVRVEAAGLQGRIVAFRVIEERYHRASGPSAPDALELEGGSWMDWVLTAVNGMIVLGAIYLARQNTRWKRGDRVGALRLALWTTGLSLLSLLLNSDTLLGSLTPLPPIVSQLGLAMLGGAWFWVMHLAVEPYLRRLWPESIISWTRLFSGRWRDPLVGFHILAGVALGTVAVTVVSIDRLAPEWLGELSREPLTSPEATSAALSGARQTLGTVLGMASMSLQTGMGVLIVMVVLRLCLRSPALAGAAFVLLHTVTSTGSLSNTPITWLLVVALSTLLAIATIRYGLLTLVSAVFVYVALLELPLTTDTGSWHFGITMFAAAIPAAMAVFGAATAITGGDSRRRAGGAALSFR